MGLSFNLSVEDLPFNILDRAWAAQAIPDEITGTLRGWYITPAEARDTVSEGRWRDIEPIESSWVINDIQCANNVVMVCGSYLANYLSGGISHSEGPAGKYEPTSIDSTMRDDNFIDGFFACCHYDLLEYPTAWHILPTRTLLEWPECQLDVGGGGTGVSNYQSEGGLQSMVIDERTRITTDLSYGGNPPVGTQPMFVTTVGYIPCDGLGYGFHYAGAGPFTYSLYAEQDFVPIIHTFMVNTLPATNTTLWPGILPSDGVTEAVADENPPLTPAAGAGSNEPYYQGDPYRSAEDRLGHSWHLQGVNSFPGGLEDDFFNFYDNMANSYGYVQVYPLEQMSYRGHQIGMQISTATFTFTQLAPYHALTFNPTPAGGMFPNIKPTEFIFSIPSYLYFHGDYRSGNTRSIEFAPHGEYFKVDLSTTYDKVHSDAAIWRQGFIPRRLFDVKLVYNTSSSAFNPLFFPTYQSIWPSPRQQSTLAYLVFAGDTLQDSETPTDGSAYVSGGNAVYSPCVIIGNIGLVRADLSLGQKGLPDRQTTCNNSLFYVYTRRNMDIEDVNTFSGGTNSSLDNATITSILPTLRATENASENQVYNLTFLMNVTEPESRGEILICQPWLCNVGDLVGGAMDWRVIGPLASWDGVFEDQTTIDLPTWWTQEAAQSFGITQSEVDQQIYLWNRYQPPPTYIYGEDSGTGFGGLGYMDNRNARSGPYMLFFDGGHTSTTIDYTSNSFGQVYPYAYGAMMKISEPIITGPSPDEQNAVNYLGVATVNPAVEQVYYHIINTLTTKADGVAMVSNNWAGVTLNGIDIAAGYPGTTLPPPSLIYTTIDSLVTDLNTALAYVKSAGAPYDQNTPTGLEGITFYKTSDGHGVYARIDNAILAANANIDPTIYDAGLRVNNAAFLGDADNYPYNVGASIIYPFMSGPVTTDGIGRLGGNAAVEELTMIDTTVSVNEVGELFNTTILTGRTDSRYAMSGDYDIDRAQWLFIFGDTPANGGMSAVSSVADFIELLDQTTNFPFVDTTAATGLGGGLFTARQGSPSFDGMVWQGVYDTAAYLTTNNIKSKLTTPPTLSQEYRISGTTGRSVKVWLNYLLYDGLEAIIAVEVMNLGLRVNPENVEWYKRKIIGQEKSDISLEEIEEWMAMQRKQYQDLLKVRDRGYRMRKRKRSISDDLEGDFYALDEQSIDEILPELVGLPPNPDTDERSDIDAFGNVTSGDIRKVDEKRRDSEN